MSELNQQRDDHKMLNLGRALSQIWMKQDNYEDEARTILSNFDDESWVEFAAVDVAATVGLKNCKFIKTKSDELEIISEDKDRQGKAVLKIQNTESPQGNPEKNTIFYIGFSRVVKINSDFEETTYTERDPVIVLLAMKHMYYHGDSMLLHPREWGSPLENISKQYELPESYIHSLLCLLPIAIPR